MKIYKKNIYHLDNEVKASAWIGKNEPPKEFPKLTSALKVKETNWGFGLGNTSFSLLVANANNILENSTSVYILNGGLTRNIGKHYINKDNFYKCVSLFTARNVKGNWVNDKDEYIKPNENL